MPRLSRSARNYLYNETEAAAALGVTVARLHAVLDQHIFNNGNPRPSSLQFTSNDLLLLGYWCEGLPGGAHEVITMPKRG